MAQERESNLGAVINQSTRPRMLIRGFKDDPELISQLSTLVPTSRVIDSLAQVRQAEWDLLVTDRDLTDYIGPMNPVSAAPHLCVVIIPKDNFLSIESRITWAGSIAASNGHICQELRRVKGLPERIEVLTHEQLEPVLKGRSTHKIFYIRALQRTGTIGIETDPPELLPFIMTADGYALAGRYMRSANSQAWLLPNDASDAVGWVKAALAEWHAMAPDRFPGVPDWSHRAEWMTPQERSLAKQLGDLAQEREEILQEIVERERALKLQARVARESADAYERALLTEQSDELVEATMRALQELGFIVANRDAQAKPRENLEDLRVEDPDEPGWLALCEVKGYTKGAKTEAIGQFIRFQARYVQETGKLPSASWYVVNQFLARDPSTRQSALHGSDDDVAAFASAGGLVIDTVVLFRLLMEVRDGARQAVDARKLLRSSTGRVVPQTANA